MDFLLNISNFNKISCAVITINNVTTFSIFSNINDTTFEEKLYELFYNDKILIEK